MGYQGDRSSDAGTEGLARDTAHDMLASCRRRHLVDYLHTEADPPVPLDQVTAAIRMRLAGRAGNQPTEDELKEGLYHHHLPRLAGADIVEFDPDRETIRAVESDRLEALHDHMGQLIDD